MPRHLLQPRRNRPGAWASTLVLFALVAGCAEDFPTTGPAEARGGAARPLTVDPTTLHFGSPTEPAATITASVQFVGVITAASSNTGCATVSPQSIPATKPPGSSVYVATFAVAPAGAGSCTITLSDKKGGQARVDVTVDASVVLLRHTLVASGDHTCGLIGGGAAYCWGLNHVGQLGDGTTTNRAVPTAVGGGLVFASLTAGSAHVCGLTGGGTAYCWGYNGEGQLGDGTTTDRTSPTAVAGGLKFVALSAQHLHSCGLTESGAVYCWGYNANAAVGDGTTTDRTSPTAVTGGLTFARLASGTGAHSCALTAAGAAYCWGRNTEGQLGDGTATDRTAPTAVGGSIAFTDVTLGGAFTCGLTESGAVYCWGLNGDGQLGDGTTTDRNTPVALTGGQTFASLVLGASHSCGLTGGGSTYCWGSNVYGQVGDGSLTDRTAPVAVTGDPAYGVLALGRHHTCALGSAGAAYCWGINDYGQLGDETTTDSSVPVEVHGGVTFALP